MVSGSTHNSRAGSFAHRPFIVTSMVRAAGAARLQTSIIAIDGSYAADCVTAVCGTLSSYYVNGFCGRSETQGHIRRISETREFSFTNANLGPAADLALDSGVVYQPGSQYPSRDHLEILFRQKASYSFILKQAGMEPEKLVELVLEHTGLDMTLDEARKALVRDEQGLAGTKDFRPCHGDPDDSASAVLGLALAREDKATSCSAPTLPDDLARVRGAHRLSWRSMPGSVL